jgi:hypothetical protein
VAALQPLQGTWEGAVLGEKSDNKITITIAGSSFHFHRDTNFWFETTITLVKPWHGQNELQAKQQNPLFGKESGVVNPAGERAPMPGAANPRRINVDIKDSAPSQRAQSAKWSSPSSKSRTES